TLAVIFSPHRHDTDNKKYITDYFSNAFIKRSNFRFYRKVESTMGKNGFNINGFSIYNTGNKKN
ncbi:hypothetical protein SAMN05192550_2750, partial [Flavobacterium glycines]